MAVKKEKIEDKAAKPEAHKGGMVRVRVKPLRGVGGVGGPGTEALMPREQAEQYAREGYVEILTEGD